MPKEVTSKDEVAKLLDGALEVRVVADEKTAKLKVRTKRFLYTYKTTPEEAELLTKGLKVPVVELGQEG